MVIRISFVPTWTFFWETLPAPSSTRNQRPTSNMSAPCPEDWRPLWIRWVLVQSAHNPLGRFGRVPPNRRLVAMRLVEGRKIPATGPFWIGRNGREGSVRKTNARRSHQMWLDRLHCNEIYCPIHSVGWRIDVWAWPTGRSFGCCWLTLVGWISCVVWLGLGSNLFLYNYDFSLGG